MTITLQAVNEIIQSLESAGDLSIKEQKYLELAREFKQVAAENVGLKAGVTYFAYSPEYGFDYFKDKQSAIDTAQAEIDAYREDVDDGWSQMFSASNGLASTDLAGIWGRLQLWMSSSGPRQGVVERFTTW